MGGIFLSEELCCSDITLFFCNKKQNGAAFGRTCTRPSRTSLSSIFFFFFFNLNLFRVDMQ